MKIKARILRDLYDFFNDTVIMNAMCHKVLFNNCLLNAM